MEGLHSDAVFAVQPGAAPEYNRENSLLALIAVMERVQLAAEREHYRGESLQYLFPFEFLELYGPSGADWQVLDPAQQDNKTDFQKQNVRRFELGDTFLVRGWAEVDGLAIPFLRLSYRGSPDSQLSRTVGRALGASLRLWVSVAGRAVQDLLIVPFNEASGRYEVELWGASPTDLREHLGSRAQKALDRGELLVRPDLVLGGSAEFERHGLDGRKMVEIAPGHCMHPILPLRVEVAWADAQASTWDSRGGANYRYEFSMILRGFEHFLEVGISPDPHGGVGFLEYRNLLSNYGGHAGRGELERPLQPWNFDAFGQKNHGGRKEPFMAVDYMDVHVMKASCGIGLHRHRDNQEAFLMTEGRGFMVVGDWVQRFDRERCFEIRTLRAGHMALLRGGQIHGLLNPSDEDLSLFMFGGYD